MTYTADGETGICDLMEFKLKLQIFSHPTHPDGLKE